jgi:hypothetical protein
MKTYNISIYASITVEANNEQEAQDIAHDMVLNQEVKMRDFQFEAEESA